MLSNLAQVSGAASHSKRGCSLRDITEPDGPRWDAAVALTNALFRWENHPTAHPFDEPDLRFMEFLEHPSQASFRPWLDMRVDVSNDVYPRLFDAGTEVADRALRCVGSRPLKLVRHVKGSTFYHMGPLPPLPAAVHQLRIEKRKGGEGVRLWVDHLAGLLGLVEIGPVELHPWGATVEYIEHHDRLVFDLDPGDGVTWDFVVETAFLLRDMLAAERPCELAQDDRRQGAACGSADRAPHRLERSP